MAFLDHSLAQLGRLNMGRSWAVGPVLADLNNASRLIFEKTVSPRL